MELAGLILCGGQSSRMNADKSMMEYHGAPQAHYIYKVLKSVCSNVYISCNKMQVANYNFPYPVITDDAEYSNAGPLTGLLSAFKMVKQSFLITGCDYPRIGLKEIQYLFSKRDVKAPASVAFNSLENVFEPCIGIYEYSCAEMLKEYFQSGNRSLQQFLKVNHAAKINFPEEVLMDVNTPEEHASYFQNKIIPSS